MAQPSSIIEAVKAGDLAQVKSLLTTDPDLIYTKTDQKVSVVLLAAYQRNERLLDAILTSTMYHLDLFEAAALGDNERVQELVQQQPDIINTTAPDGYTPLGLASFFGQTETVKLLLAQGADVNQAAQNDWQVQPIHSAVAARNTEIARLLLEQGADVNARQQHGFTPLHTAAQHGDAELIKFLLEHHADINAQTDSGETAMDIALKCNHTEAAHMFVAG